MSCDDDELLDSIGRDFAWHAQTLALVGGLLGSNFQGDPAEAKNLPPLEEFVEYDPEAQQMARVLSRYEDLLSPEQVVVLKAVNVFGTPVPTEAITGAFAALPLPGSQKTTVPLPGPFRLADPAAADRPGAAGGIRRRGRPPVLQQPPAGQPLLLHRPAR